MKESIKFKDIDVYYRTYGKKQDKAVVLLHGYLETMDIWSGFAEKLAQHYYVITPDIPGHGKSGIFSSTHRMDDLSESVLAIIDKLEIKKIHLAGHSMGGYVTMAFRENHQERLFSYTLFHSTCFADNQEKKENRNREIEMIKEGKKELIVNTNIPKGFANDNHEKFSSEIENAKSIARTNSNEGIIALLKGMKKRIDRCALLKDDKIPLLLISGEKDNHIPVEVMQSIANMGANVEISFLPESGHMGFIEEPERSLEILTGFFRKHEFSF